MIVRTTARTWIIGKVSELFEPFLSNSCAPHQLTSHTIVFLLLSKLTLSISESAKQWRKIMSEREADWKSEKGSRDDARFATKYLSRSLREQNLYDDALKVYETSFLMGINAVGLSFLHEGSWILWLRSGRGEIAVFVDDAYKANCEAFKLMGEMEEKELESDLAKNATKAMASLRETLENSLKNREEKKKESKKYATEQRLLEQVQRKKEKAAEEKALAAGLYPERLQMKAAAEAEAKAKEAAENAKAEKAAEDFMKSLGGADDDKKGSKKGKGKGTS